MKKSTRSAGFTINLLIMKIMLEAILFYDLIWAQKKKGGGYIL